MVSNAHAMKYEKQVPISANNALNIIDGAIMVLHQQIEFYRGGRKKAWNGEFVDHSKEEAEAAINWLREHQ